SKETSGAASSTIEIVDYVRLGRPVRHAGASSAVAAAESDWSEGGQHFRHGGASQVRVGLASVFRSTDPVTAQLATATSGSRGCAAPARTPPLGPMMIPPRRGAVLTPNLLPPLSNRNHSPPSLSAMN